MRDDGAIQEVGSSFYFEGKDYVRIFVSKRKNLEETKGLVLNLENGKLTELSEAIERKRIIYRRNSMPGAFSSGLFLFEVAIPPEY